MDCSVTERACLDNQGSIKVSVSSYVTYVEHDVAFSDNDEVLDPIALEWPNVTIRTNKGFQLDYLKDSRPLKI